MRAKIIRVNVQNYDLNEWSRDAILANELIETYSKVGLNAISIDGLANFITATLKIIDKQARLYRRKKNTNHTCQFSGCGRKNRSVKAFESKDEGTVYMCAVHRAINENRTGFTIK